MVTIVARLDTESRDRAAQRTDRIVADFHLFNEETRRANCLHAPNATDTFKATNFFVKRANVLSRLRTRSSEACLCRRFFSATQYTCFPALLLSDPLPRRPLPRCQPLKLNSERALTPTVCWQIRLAHGHRMFGCVRMLVS